MNRQCVTALLAAITGLTGATAWAARETLNFEVTLTIPSRPFYILPSEPDWIHRPQHLLWNYPDSTLGGFRKNFDVRHDTSAIEARLESTPYLSNGRPGEIIDLRVRFNGVELSAAPVFRQVLSREEAATGKRVPLEIDPITPAGGYKAGEYHGNVLLLFNARAPGE
ncbi:CS1 type fimbrial major subunit [Pseudomonas sp. C2B4]|uniref:CS1 type fimbrial major subunit n=1 Tax=Pseudomonas sp. C2B4 TaxID=2735270 RepID=UPI00158643F4|nr:CS1 type fimbrial major subunit [Pseudomonas sp. C2B4]NUU36846.1 fimbrial assembly protein [Pseudomonas sp. C2B4]